MLDLLAANTLTQHIYMYDNNTSTLQSATHRQTTFNGDTALCVASRGKNRQYNTLNTIQYSFIGA